MKKKKNMKRKRKKKKKKKKEEEKEKVEKESEEKHEEKYEEKFEEKESEEKHEEKESEEKFEEKESKEEFDEKENELFEEENILVECTKEKEDEIFIEKEKENELLTVYKENTTHPFYCLVNETYTCTKSKKDCDCPEGYIRCEIQNYCVPKERNDMCPVFKNLASFCKRKGMDYFPDGLCRPRVVECQIKEFVLVLKCYVQI